MSKEQHLSVVFVYDCEACVSEADDPQDAVLYFHPAWVSEQQRLALCGQLMGATHFFLASFSCPKLISLRSGQFAIRQCGRYILAVGADHNTLQWVLQRRADSLIGLLRLFHNGLEGVALSCEYDRTTLVDKLQDILDAFVPMAQNFGDTFGHEPNLLLPKSASNVFVEAVQMLEFCQEQPGVLGGTILYNNRVVATQLSPELTRRLIYSDPSKIRGRAETVSTSLELPLGSRLLKVFLEQAEHQFLATEAAAARDAFLNIGQHRPEKNTRQFGSTMKKEISRIFTVLEEKEPFDDFDGGAISPSPTVSTPPLPFHMRKASAPLEDRYTPPPYGRFSLPAGAVTPGTLGKVLHDKRLSICIQHEDLDDDEDTREPEEPEPSLFKHSPVQSEPKFTKKISFSSSFQPIKQYSRSLDDVSASVKNHGYCGPLPIKGYSFGLPKLNQEDLSPKEKVESESGGLQRLFNTIADPSYPVFRGDGLPVSQELFDKYLEQHYCELNAEGRAQKIKPKSPEKIKAPAVIKKIGERPQLTLNLQAGPQVSTPNRQEIYRRSLSLPIKPIVMNGTDDDDDDALGRRKSFVPEHGRLQDIEMTPLSSILSFSERTGTPGEVPGFPRAATTPGARVTTPAEFRSFLAESRRKEMANGDVSAPEENGNNQEEMTQAILYVYGYQGMNLLLLLDHQDHADWDLLETLGEAWLGAAPQLESKLRRCLEQTAGSSSDTREPYSFLFVDPSWDALQRGGTWGPNQLSVARRLHSDLRSAPDMTEVIARCDEQIVYGYQCCRQQVFYQQPAGPKVGLPTPADLMGTVPLKAKRRLERDHGIVLL